MTESYPFPLEVRRLIELQLELECKRVLEGNSLMPVPCANPDPLPRFLLLRHPQSYTAYFRHDLPTGLRRQLAALPLEQAFSESHLVKALLELDRPCEDIWHGSSYVFPPTLTAAAYPDAVQLTDERHQELLQQYPAWKSVGNRTVYGLIVNDHIVASCGSVRENKRSAEAWVTTEPAFRGRGYARQVTAAWAHHLQQVGKIPFYCHAQQNVASERVAHSLGLLPFLTGWAYS